MIPIRLPPLLPLAHLKLALEFLTLDFGEYLLSFVSMPFYRILDVGFSRKKKKKKTSVGNSGGIIVEFIVVI